VDACLGEEMHQKSIIDGVLLLLLQTAGALSRNAGPSGARVCQSVSGRHLADKESVPRAGDLVADVGSCVRDAPQITMTEMRIKLR